MKPSTVLKKARKLVEKGWCKGPPAVNRHGDLVPVEDNAACRWCAIGAIWRAAGDEDSPLAYAAGNFADRVADGNIIGLNERSRDKRPVLRAFDRAIKLAISEGQ